MGSQKQSVVDVGDFSSSIPDNMKCFTRKLKSQGSGIVLSGTGTTCSKQISHYTAFRRNEITIPVHSFVYVMAEGGGHYVGYLIDLYVDKRGNKRANVMCFQHNRELKSVIPDLRYDPREIFMTPHVQSISVDCIEGIAIVLKPIHYEKCLDVVSLTVSTQVHVCSRQIVNNKVIPFYVDALHGYTYQPILASIDSPHRLETPVYNTQVENLNPRKQIMKREPPVNRLKIKIRNGGDTSFDPVKSEAPSHVRFTVGEKIEVLSQDSGTSGCWFRCKVLKASPKVFRVQYVDILDADDITNLEEHISAYQLAATDKLGMRYSGRPTIRPYPPQKDDSSVVVENKNYYEIGCAVDAWWCDGWWEGFVIGQSETDETLQVYFPGEKRTLTMESKDLRISRDWIGYKWVDLVMINMEILTCISAERKTVGNKLAAVEK